MNYPILNRILSSSLADIDKNVLKKALKELSKKSYLFEIVDQDPEGVEPLNSDDYPPLKIYSLKPFPLRVAEVGSWTWREANSNLKRELKEKLQPFFSSPISDLYIDGRDLVNFDITVVIGQDEYPLEIVAESSNYDEAYNSVRIFDDINFLLDDPSTEIQERTEKFLRDYITKKKKD